MATIIIRIDDELEERVAAAAQNVGNTAHAFIVDAIAQKVERVEEGEELDRIADRRWAKVLATAETIPWDDAKKQLVARGERSVRLPVFQGKGGLCSGLDGLGNKATWDAADGDA